MATRHSTAAAPAVSRGLQPRDQYRTAIVARITLLVVLLKRRDFVLYASDPQQARVMGLDVRLLHYGLLVLLSLTIVASLQAVGIIVVVAMLIAPGATAFLVTRTFGRMLAVAMAVAIGSSLLGTFISFHIDAATGPCIVLIQTAVFLLALFVAPRTGLLMRRVGVGGAATAER